MGRACREGEDVLKRTVNCKLEVLEDMKKLISKELVGSCQ